MTADLTIVIPTQGRATLPRCLASMAAEVQPGPRPEILVVADTHSPLLMDVAALCRDAGVTYLEHDAGRHDWGYPQLQHGYERAQGGHIMNIGDDDVYEPGAFAVVRAALAEAEGRLPFFRAELHPSPHRGHVVPTLCWIERGRFERSWVTGQNFVCPNDPSVMGYWEDDFYQMAATVHRLGGTDVLVWRDEAIARCY